MILRACQTCRYVKETSEFYGSGYSCKACDKNRKLLLKYGITTEDWLKLRQAQNYQCGICGVSEQELGKVLFVDHCHGTGKVRGMLCMNCNFGLGYFKDNVGYMVKGVEYLEKSRK